MKETVTRTAIGNRKSAIENRKIPKLFLCAFAAYAVCVLSAWAGSSPFLIPYQGRLTNPQGVAYTNGQYTIAFNLYDQPVGGSNLWSETHFKVGVVNGIVNVFLGSINPGISNVDFSQTRHLGITIYADNNPNNPAPEMVPRQMIIPAFSAKNSEKLAGYDWSALFVGGNPVSGVIPGSKIQPGSISALQIANGAITATQIANGTITAQQLGSGVITSNQIGAAAVDASNLAADIFALLVVPPGSVSAYMGTNAPSGWLLCDGSIQSIAQYPALFNVIGTSCGAGTNGSTFRLPDLRGTFLRGADALPDFTFAASAVVTNPANTITIPNHGINRTGYPLAITNLSGSLPGGLLAVNSDGSVRAYYAIIVDANTIKLAASDVNAFANIPVALTSQGTGSNKLISWIDLDKNNRTAASTGGNAGNAIGSIELDAFKSHTHSAWNGGGGLNGWVSAGPSISSQTGPAGGNETRPKNVYVNYIIKY